MFRGAKAGRTAIAVAPGHGDRPGTAATLFAYRVASEIVGKGAMLVLTVAAARTLSSDGFGLFSLGSTAGWIGAVASDAGIQMHVARLVARAPSEAHAILRRWLRVRLWTACAAVASIGLVSLAVAGASHASGTVLVLAIYYALCSLVELTFHVFRGLSRTDLESSITIGQRLSILLFGLAALAVIPEPFALGAALALPAAAVFLVSVTRARTLASRAAAKDVEPSAIAVPSGRPLALELGTDVLPIGAGIVLSALYFRVDVLLLAEWIGTEAVATYSAVFRLVEALRLIPAAALAVAWPVLCRATSLRPLRALACVLTAGAVLVAVTLALGGGRVISLLYGPQYEAGVPAFRILLLAFPLMALNYALTHQLLGWNRHLPYAVICGAALVLNLALNARLIPALSIDGAAWTTLATEALVTCGCLVVLLTGPNPARSTGAHPSHAVVAS